MPAGLRLKGVKHNRQFVPKPDLTACGVDLYVGAEATMQVIEHSVFPNAVRGKGELTVLPEQAIVVTHILEAIYESAKTGKPYYFEKRDANE